MFGSFTMVLLEGTTAMTEQLVRRLPLMALLMAGLVLGACVTALAATGSTPAGACGPGTAEQIGSVKAPPAGLWALVQSAVLSLLGLFTFTRLVPPTSSPRRLDLLWSDSASRAPPLS